MNVKVPFPNKRVELQPLRLDLRLYVSSDVFSPARRHTEGSPLSAVVVFAVTAHLTLFPGQLPVFPHPGIQDSNFTSQVQKLIY